MKESKENIEEQILLFIDGELPESEREELLEKVKNIPEYRQMLELYLSTKLEKEDLAFPGQESLIRKQQIPVLFYKQAALAAAIAVLLVLGAALLYLSKPNSQMPTTQTRIAIQASEIHKPELLLPKHKPDKGHSPLPAGTGKPSSQSKHSPRLAILHAIRKTPARNDLLPDDATIFLTPLPVMQNPVIESAPPEIIPASFCLEMPVRQKASYAKDVPAGPLRMPGWMPIENSRLQGLNDLIQHIQEVKETVVANVNTLQSATVVLQVGHKQVIINNKENF
jgi:hypothetical protein